MINEPIQEAEILEATPSNADLLSALEAPTETKTPSATTNDGWRFELETDSEPTAQQFIDDSEQSVKDETLTDEKTNPIKNVLSKSKIASQAKLNVSFLDLTQKTLLKLYLDKKFKKKYTEHENELLETDLIYKPKEQLTETEQVLKYKYKTLEAKKNKKEKIIPFDLFEKQELEKILAEYSETSGELMPPWLVTVLSVGQIFIKRIEVFTED